MVLSSRKQAAWPLYAVGVPGPDFDGDIDYTPLRAGESCAAIDDIKPAATIVHDPATEAGKAVANASSRSGS